VARENKNPGEPLMADTLAGMLIGVIAGYLTARHTAEIEWVLHALIG
jgi:F0F1-type ATP synthase assembly protein I